ncbi:MAG: hypothetical protein ACXADX_19330 [Candidatus Hodarchaeales archaeon]|jgi:hypothetical protein
MPRKVEKTDSYLNSLLKLIPSELVAVYLAIQAILIGQDVEELIFWLVAVLFVVITPIWLFTYTDIPKDGVTLQEARQLIASTLAMGIWVFSLGGPFSFNEWYQDNAEWAVLVVLLLWTFLIAPLIQGTKAPQLRGPYTGESSQS